MFGTGLIPANKGAHAHAATRQAASRTVFFLNLYSQTHYAGPMSPGRPPTLSSTTRTPNTATITTPLPRMYTYSSPAHFLNCCSLLYNEITTTSGFLGR